ncbi:hypothetical protein [Yinghuangia seranimata]|uniref:hypothetical protein n=1 Tax=Yinghuangia seranimata TaxID=408067 RepID=UPI00248BAC7F|nr:hypothetical protein [Yinghuangia seranimata]MDI2130525.1 hypothetical protein [Yinghuangia seranimata]
MHGFRRFARGLTATGLVLAGLSIASAPSASASARAPSGQSPAQRVVTELAAIPDLLGGPSANPATSAATSAASSGVSIELNGAHGTTTRPSAGLTVTPDALPHVDAAVRTDATGTSHIVVLRDRKAPSSATFTVNKAGTHLVADPLGGVVLVGADGAVDSRISSPWAYDARGRSLPTSFVVSGNTITQHIDTRGAAYPVVADPHWKWGIVTGTLYFNRAETRYIAAYENWLTLAGWFVPAPFNFLLAIYQLYLHYEAQYAESVGICVKIKTNGSIGTYGGSQGDGYCR